MEFLVAIILAGPVIGLAGMAMRNAWRDYGQAMQFARADLRERIG